MPTHCTNCGCHQNKDKPYNEICSNKKKLVGNCLNCNCSGNCEKTTHNPILKIGLCKWNQACKNNICTYAHITFNGLPPPIQQYDLSSQSTATTSTPCKNHFTKILWNKTIVFLEKEYTECKYGLNCRYNHKLEGENAMIADNYKKYEASYSEAYNMMI